MHIIPLSDKQGDLAEWALGWMSTLDDNEREELWGEAYPDERVPTIVRKSARHGTNSYRFWLYISEITPRSILADLQYRLGVQYVDMCDEAEDDYSSPVSSYHASRRAHNLCANIEKATGVSPSEFLEECKEAVECQKN